MTLGKDAAAKRHAFVLRKITRFLGRVANAQRLQKKVNLGARNARADIWDTYSTAQAG